MAPLAQAGLFENDLNQVRCHVIEGHRQIFVVVCKALPERCQVHGPWPSFRIADDTPGTVNDLHCLCQLHSVIGCVQRADAQSDDDSDAVVSEASESNDARSYFEPTASQRNS
jgi:hypothetical protein